MINGKSNLSEIVNNFRKYAHIKSVCRYARTSHMHALITVVIPTYDNKEGLLERALDSVLNQEDFDDYNVLIVSNSHMDEHELNHLLNRSGKDRISYYENEENIGQCGNWNRCVELSEAKYTVMLHDDDYIMLNYLKEVIQIVKKRPNAGMIVTNRLGETKINLERAELPFERFQLLDLYPHNQLGAPTGMLFRTDYAKEIGGWNENVLYWDCWFNALFLERYPVYVTPLKLTYYRSDSSRYEKALNIDLAEGEYYLGMRVLQFVHIPLKVAKIVCMKYLINMVKGCSLLPNDISIEIVQYTKFEEKWALRYFKFVRLLRHSLINIRDKVCATLYK